MEESIHVIFYENRRGSENLLDPEEEEFIIQTSIQDEPGSSSAEIEEDDDRPIPSSGILPTIIPDIPDKTIEALIHLS